MNLGITVDQVIDVKMGAYLNSLPEEERVQKKQEYIEAGQASIQSDIDEAESLADSVQSTAQQIIESIPIWTTQIASIAAGIANPITSIPSITALATMKQNISATKDTVTRAFSQIKRITGILTTFGVTSIEVATLVNLLTTAQSGLDSIPEIEIPEEPTEPEPEEPEPEESPNVHRYEVKSGNVNEMVMDSEIEYYIFKDITVSELPAAVTIIFPPNPSDGETHTLHIDYSTTPSSSGPIHFTVDFFIKANEGQSVILLTGPSDEDVLHRGEYAHYLFVEPDGAWVRIC